MPAGFRTRQRLTRPMPPILPLFCCRLHVARFQMRIKLGGTPWQTGESSYKRASSPRSCPFSQRRRKSCPRDRQIPFYKVIFDHRFQASREFGGEMEKLGAKVHGIHGDITDLWFHDLYHRWKEGPAPIAGMTAHGPLFCLERLAWDRGMRVLSRTEHPPVGDSEPLITWVIGPKASGAGSQR